MKYKKLYSKVQKLNAKQLKANLKGDTEKANKIELKIVKKILKIRKKKKDILK